jgi:hypothetical protein
MKNAPKCQACRLHLQKIYRAVGSYGWVNELGERLKSDLCADHAKFLRKSKKVIVLRSYR